MQVSRSSALDAAAIGVMGVDAAIAAIVLGTKSDHDLWITAAMLLGLSFGLAMRTLWLPGAENFGPFAASLLSSRGIEESDHDLEWLLFEDLTADALINKHALADKTPPLLGALSLMTIAIFVELAGLIH